MQKGFRKILVPVYPSVDAESAISRAIELSNPSGTTIYIVNIQNPFLHATGSFFSNTSITSKPMVKEWLKGKKGVSGLQIEVESKKAATIREGIVKKAKEEQVDLIVIGASVNNWWFPFFRGVYIDLAQLSNCHVLKIKKERTKGTAVVVPFDNKVCNEALDSVCWINNEPIQVHLVDYGKHKDDTDTASIGLLKAFQTIKTHNWPVEYTMLHGSNKRSAVDKYLHQIENDVLLISTGVGN